MRTHPFPFLSALLLAGCGSTVVRIDGDAGPAPTIDVAPPQDTGNTPDRTPPADAPTPVVDAPVPPPDVPLRPGAVDLLLVVDNSNSMLARQLQLASALPSLLSALADPRAARPVRDVHIGVVSTDLGAGGRSVPSCSAERGDDGALNPIARGRALQSHLPWTTLPPGARPARCTTNTFQYPMFLTWSAGADDPMAFSEDLLCNALLSTGGCGLEQPLEAAHRALVGHDARQPSGVNGGFVRDDAVLAILVLTDEEDGSVRDCSREEPGDPDGDCRSLGDARDVFDNTSTRWASADLNQRFYRYATGSRQDPTWSLNRYVDPSRPSRGFLGLKPGHPERVVLGALTGVPLDFSRQLNPTEWTALLGEARDGSQGHIGMSPGGVVSMRQNNPDPDCPTRVTPACRQEGTMYTGTCNGTEQPFALPARRIAEVARRLDAAHGNGVLGSICNSSYDDFVRRMAVAIQRRVGP